ncbi:DnaJ and TPR domain protein [Penicillium brasilianum]|uniref:Tetratricopeptide repeat and J domain-containing co-chaperone DNJ1 n=1 Tax=Penicillium brasilianum TaxID=104259 RepID=A0A1S9RMX4_PENBI|nr:DnaJ and TPR domain protein [Penicillium brasilianum]
MRFSLETVTAVLACLSTTYALQIPPDTPLSELISSAKAHLAKGSPRDALVYFDAAVSRDPTNYITIYQRGAAYLSIGKNTQASEDFNRVLELKPDFEGALLQRSRLQARSAHWKEALQDLERAGKKDSVEYQEIKAARDAAALALAAEKKGDWEACVMQAGVAIMKANTDLSLRQARAHCRFERGELEEGVSDLAHVLQISPNLVEPHLQMSSMLFYALGDSDRGLAQIRKCLHTDPDSKACNRLYKRERQLAKSLGKLHSALEARKFSNAVKLMVDDGEDTGLITDVKNDVAEARKAGHIHPAASNHLYVFLVEKTCESYREMRMLKKAGPYCAESLQLVPYSLHGLLYKAQIELDGDQFEEAVRTLNTAREHHPHAQEVQSLLQKAQALLKRSKQKDYYKVLGVSRDADERTIKRAYRQLMKQHHPDKAHAQGIPKEEAEKKMASINEAYEVLSDSELRTRYDNGDDPNDPESQQRGNPFQGSPFGHGGGQQFFFQQGGQQFKFGGQGFGGFPFR